VAQGILVNRNDSWLIARRGLPILLACLLALPALAQTREQLEIFQSLPADQQRMILEEMSKRNPGRNQPAALQAAPTQDSEKASAPDDGQSLLPGFLEFEELRLRAGDYLLISVAPLQEGAEVPGSGTNDQRSLAEFREQLLAGNPYRLDPTGRLELPGSLFIVLAGLTSDEAKRRLDAEPKLGSLEFRIAMLPVEPELRPFGYDMFKADEGAELNQFVPETAIPVPANYVVGPGDTLELQLIGEDGGYFSLTVGRDGTVDVPEIGPVAVAGLRFAAAKETIEKQVAEQLIGIRANVTIGALRSIQVFVLGEAVRPGSHTVGGLATITHALIASGGVRPIGSLRNIQLKRNGQVVRRLDLYDLLLDGDSSHDDRLQPGDVIFIPPVGLTVGVSGEVRRPAIYELPEGAVASELLRLAGGLTPEADPRTGRLERVDRRLNRTIVDVDLTTGPGRDLPLQAGDMIRVERIRDIFEGSVQLAGHVHRPGSVQHRPGMRLTDLIGSIDELKPFTDLHYVLIRRESGPSRTVSVVSANLALAFKDPQSPANVILQSRDQVHVFDLASRRERVVTPIMKDLERQSSLDQPLRVVTIGGRVTVPGQYPLSENMTVSELLRAGGGLAEAAYGGEAELTRYEIVDGERRQTELIRINLADVVAGVAAADVLLQPYDYLIVKEMPDWRERESVSIEGEVRFPGTYPVKRGETLREVVARAGGLTDLAFAEGSVFTRRELREREQRQFVVMRERLQRELALLSLEQAQSGIGASDAMAAGQQVLADLESTQAVGRLVISLQSVLTAEPGSIGDIVLKDGDRLMVPRMTQEVTVIGEVQYASSHLLQPGVGHQDYVARAGGTTRRADEGRTFVIRADGSVAQTGGSAWFAGGAEVRPGDTIVVPINPHQMRPLTFWTSITQILYNIAIAVAAVNSF
jgi:protein involved in polysaccharide export with SLBB domain